MADYLGAFSWACIICGKVHFMERDADRCCPKGIYPPTPIVWKADDSV